MGEAEAGSSRGGAVAMRVVRWWRFAGESVEEGGWEGG